MYEYQIDSAWLFKNKLLEWFQSTEVWKWIFGLTTLLNFAGKAYSFMYFKLYFAVLCSSGIHTEAYVVNSNSPQVFYWTAGKDL